MKTPVRYVSSFLPCIFLLLAIQTHAADLQQFTGIVVSVIDGDTVTVLTQDKRQAKIRLYGIDCPENGQAFGARAKQAASDAVFGKSVTVQPIDRDRDGQTAAIVSSPGGKPLHEQLVRDGLAWVDPRLCTREDICAPLKKLEASVRASQRGLWIDKKPVPPWEWRKRRGAALDGKPTY